jgi:acyl-CoA-dependent ceramide synthase
MLKYFKLQRLCDFTFFLFLISWPYTRHYLYNVIVYSSYVDLPRYFHRDNRNSPFYQITPPKGGGEWGEGYNWNPQQGYYFTSEVHMAFLVLLATLQAILILWFATIIRLASRVIRGAHAEDERSDDEASDYEEDEIQHDPDVTLLEVANGNIPTRTNGGIPSTNGITLSNGIHQRKIAV